MSRQPITYLAIIFAISISATTAFSECLPLYEFRGEGWGNELGRSVASAGDVDDDGYDDLIIGAPYWGITGAYMGRVYVFSGRTGDTLYVFTGENNNDGFGWDVASAGDVNNDGFDDVIIGARENDAGGDNSGRVYLFSGQDGDTLYMLTGENAGDGFGFSVGTAGDANNDGYDDFMATAPWSDNNGLNSGTVYIFSGLNGDTLHTFSGAGADDLFGFSAGAVGDLDNDNCFDLIIGASQFQEDGVSGRVYLFSGKTGDTLFILNGTTGENFGESVSSAGDVNADGYNDFIIGSSTPYTYPVGSATVFSGISGDTIYYFMAESAGDGFGRSVSGAGDANDDGYDDLIIGAYRFDGNGMYSGRVYLFSGKDGDTLSVYTGENEGDQFGLPVANAGDVNNDGFDDVIIGASRNSDIDHSSGKAYVFPGGPCGKVIYVPDDYPTIQAGIDAAVDGDTVLVTPGTYTGEGNRDIDFGGKNLVLMSENGPEATIIDCDASFNNQHRAFLLVNVDFGTAINGFTIMAGVIEDMGDDEAGAAIYCENSTALINNCVFIDNSAACCGGDETRGTAGAVYGLSSVMDINNSVFEDNAATIGGAIAIYSGTLRLEGCYFRNNIAYSYIEGLEDGVAKLDGHGGAVYCQNSTLSINQCLFERNISQTIDSNDPGLGSAIRAEISTTFQIFNSTFFQNNGVPLYLDQGLMENSLVAFNGPGEPIMINDSIAVTCSDIYGNTGGDWVGSIADQADINGNFSADPLFCDTANDNFYISSLSPCAPMNNSCRELVGALNVNCGPDITFETVYLDIKPGSCPNPINIKDNGKGNSVVPTAILGTDDLDVHDIDVNSLRLAGIAPLRWSYEDEASPIDSDDSCTCTEAGHDGHDDLLLKFDKSSVIAAILSNPGDQQLTITGFLKDSTQITGSDCIEIRPKGKITIDSATGEVVILSAAGDITGDGMINLQDVTYALSYLYNPNTQNNPDAQLDDINCDDLVNLLDITALIAYLYMDAPAPDCP